jgi:zinc transport system ATP-binding protein
MILRNFTIDEVGYVPQKVNIDPTFPITVREFLEVYLHTNGIWKQHPLPEFDKKLSIDHLLDRKLGKLSGGQLQRVLLAAVLNTKPTILFLDEFSTGIDPQGQAELFHHLHRLNERDHVTIIMISHDIDITAQYADDVLCLNKTMVCHGKPHDIFTAENFERMYGIPLTKLESHHHND